MKLGIVLFNLGGPDGQEAVEPFLRNLFSDPAIISLPGILRLPLARFIARRRAPVAQKIYAHIGGRSPILEETQAQARALEAALNRPGLEVKAVVAMRCWHPFSDEAAGTLKHFAAEHIVLLPLYPQFSTSTSASSFKDWDRAAGKSGAGIAHNTRLLLSGQYGVHRGGWREEFKAAMENPLSGVSYRLLFSAHGLPKRIIERGDPYQWQVEKTARALVDALGITDLDWGVCYQSRVGPLKWLEPSTDAEIRRAGQDGKGVIVVPIAFVSEHSETLVELDIEYGKLAREAGVPDYRRAATVGADPAFIAGLSGLVEKALANGACVNDGEGRICPPEFGRCGYREGKWKTPSAMR